MDIDTHVFEITGISGLIMHCGQTADPLNKFAKAMGKLSKKRNKTDDDLMQISDLEWWAGLYTDVPADINDDCVASINPAAKLILPAHVLDSMIREGARKSKMGKQASAGCIVTGDGELVHDGPNNINKIAADEKYRRRDAVKVGQSKVMRTRPFFQTWGCIFEVQIDESVIEVDTVRHAIQMAGRLVGIGDWRPGAPRGGSWGRFELNS